MKLLTCPFCGGKASVKQEYTLNIICEHVECNTCHARTTAITTDPIEAWNTRAERTCKDKCGSDEAGMPVFNCDFCDCVLSLYQVDGTNNLCIDYVYDYPRYCPSCGARVVGDE